MSDRIPTKIKAAMMWLNFARSIEGGASENCWLGTSKSEGRELLPLEGEVRDAALVCLLEYFESPGVGEAPLPESQPAEADTFVDLIRDNLEF